MDDLDVAVDDFQMYIASEKGLSPHTLEAYGRDISGFISFLRNSGVKEFPDVKQAHVISYLELLRQKGYASSSICRALMAFKVMYRFFKREKIVKDNILLYLESPKLWQLIPNVLSTAEVDKLLNQPSPDTMIGARDRAILKVLYASGLRVSELCGLGINDVDDKFVRVVGKGNKERLVPIGRQAIEAVDHYLINYRDGMGDKNSKQLFLSQRGKGIDRITIWKRVKAYAKAAGIKKEISPHTLRHSFATHLLDNGADLRIIQDMMGHASIGSTDRYTHVSRNSVRSRFEQFHPRNTI